MHSKWVFKHFYPQTGKRDFLLILVWVIGLLVGVLLCALSPDDSAEVLSDVASVKPSTVSLFLVCVLPVVFSAIAVRFHVSPIAYFLIFLNTVSHGFCGMAINIAFGSSAWIVRPLLLFSSGCSSVLVLWLLLQKNIGRHLRKHICFALGISCLIYILDLLLVSPFVGDLIKVL